MPGMNGLEFIRALQERGEEAQVVMVTAHASVASAVEAMRHGAFDYIEKPFDVDQLEQLVARALRHGRRLAPPLRSPRRGPAAAMIGSTPHAGPAAQDPTGGADAGNGADHGRKRSGQGAGCAGDPCGQPPRRRAFVSLNCPALSPQLMESELFGHERGAFTSADAPRIGRFESAHGGTILLDEVTEISLPLQAKLLRVLQERTFERVGSSKRAPPTCACWQRATATSAAKWPRAAFARICTFAWQSSRSTCRRSANAARTCPNSPSTSCSRPHNGWESTPANWLPMPAICWSPAHWRGNVRELRI